jgi:uncharacterized protein involved in exopolysaccharide biosynthesis
LTSALRRYGWLSLLFFLASMALVVFVLLIIPRAYESEGKFIVLLGRGTVSLDPTATTGKNVNIQETRDSEINSVADILESRALMEQVVDAIGVDPLLESKFVFRNWIKLPEFELPSFSGGLAEEESAQVDASEGQPSLKELKRRERAITRLANNLKVKPTKKAATISVSCRANSPGLARSIVQHLMSSYQVLHIKAHHTAGSYPFFEEQFRLHQHAMSDVQNELRDFKNQIGIVSIEGERASLQRQIDRVAVEMLQTEVDLASATERSRKLQEQHDALDARIVSSRMTGAANEGADLMRDRLFSLEMREKELLARFHETHPDVRSVRESIAKAKDVLADHPYERSEITTSVNPTKLDIQGRLLSALADVHAIRARRSSLDGQKGELLVKLEALNRNEAQSELLKKRLEIASINFRTYAEKMEEARINQALDAERISNVNVFQEPTYVVKAVSPKRMLILAASFVVVSIVSVGLALLLNSWNQTIRTAEELSKTVEVPVLVTLPRSSSGQLLNV